MRETAIENEIIAYIESQGGYAIKLNSGMAFKKYAGKSYMIRLCPKGTPDIDSILNGVPIKIEVKTTEKGVQTWLRLQKRHYKGETLPKSYKRELDQIKQAEKIIKAGGKFIITHSLEDFKKDL